MLRPPNRSFGSVAARTEVTSPRWRRGSMHWSWATLLRSGEGCSSCNRVDSPGSSRPASRRGSPA